MIPLKLKKAVILGLGSSPEAGILKITSYFRGFLVEKDPTHL